MKVVSWALVVAAVLFSGCASSYSWRSRVPESMRTVHIPSFRSDADLMEIGALATRQLGREFQREGTFKLVGPEDPALEIQGNIISASSLVSAYSRRSVSRFFSYGMTLEADVSVIDKRKGEVIIDNRHYTAYTTYAVSQDTTTAERDASGRLADELARQIVDDVLNLKW